MQIVKVNNYEEMSEKAADLVTGLINQSKKSVLGLATGSTPEKLYDILVERNIRKEISFQQVKTFNLDEYVGLGENDLNSYRYYMNEKLFHKVDIEMENTYIPNGLATSLDKECERYEQEIQKAGTIDLQLLGLGLNGHIGFNEPGSSFNSRTHVTQLDQSTIEANARFFKTPEDVPTKVITMGIGTIMKAKQILLLVQGEKKAEILKKAIEGEVTEHIPASILQRHSNVTLITDISI
ncbi:glucosamine-6-phosphate deaminase [Pseudogracilibacillus sp. SE30717A]|uniref:glucosamine-6-phosphate deaminase n=1 Tax=Pseudogracilibacillus sp. SE30717A TaxID=3098293 RepID=UPI00300E0462